MAPKYRFIAPQMAHPTDDYPAPNPYKTNTVQKVVGTLLYYARAVDPIILVALNTIAAKKIENYPGNSRKSGAASKLYGHPPCGNHQVPCQRKDPTHA